jgi:DNA-directed RNA polymerase subunit RPC12/RpoP
VSDLRQQSGTHTWDIIIDYECCPYCSYIVENRGKYEKDRNGYHIDLICTRCKREFTVVKKVKPVFETPLWIE